MKKKNMLIDKLNEIDEKFLDELHDRRNRRFTKRKNMMRYCSIAASLVIVVAISVAAILPMSRNTPTNIPSETKDSVTTETIETQTDAQTQETISADNIVNKPQDTSVIETEPVIGPENISKEYFVSITADYVATDLKDIAGMADLVIRVKYEKDIDTYVSSGMLPITRSEFAVVDVLKGDYDSSSIIAQYYGGTVSMYEYLQEMSELEKLKGGYDYTDEEAKQIDVTYLDEKNGVYLENDTEYVLCLGYDEADGTYMILADAFGMSEISDGQVYNRVKSEYIKIGDIFE